MARPAVPLSPCVCNTLRMATRVVTQLYDDALRPSGLRVTQFSMLAAIARLGLANLRQLEETLAIDQTTLTRSLGLLERDGLTERVDSPDRRVKAAHFGFLCECRGCSAILFQLRDVRWGRLCRLRLGGVVGYLTQ